MTNDELRGLAGELLFQAAAVRTAHPDATAMQAVTLPNLPLAQAVAPDWRPLFAVLRALLDEALLVQIGRGAVGVLDDEIAAAEAALRNPPP